MDGIIIAATMLAEKSYKEFFDQLGVPYMFVVRQPTNTIGKLAAMQLIESITEEKANTTNIVIRPEIVVRKST